MRKFDYNSKIYPVSAALYNELSERLQDAIDGENYYSGSICFTHDDAACRLTASLLVYRERYAPAPGPITDLVPVWWEFHTEIDGEEQLNDFELTELKRYLIS